VIKTLVTLVPALVLLATVTGRFIKFKTDDVYFVQPQEPHMAYRSNWTVKATLKRVIGIQQSRVGSLKDVVIPEKGAINRVTGMEWELSKQARKEIKQRLKIAKERTKRGKLWTITRLSKAVLTVAIMLILLP
jgi:hypothetical protein